MAQITSSLIVRLLDQVSGPAKAAASSLRGIGAAARGVGNIPVAARLGAAIQSNNQALADSRMQMVDAVAGFYLLKRAIGAPIGAAIGFESAMADVRKVVDFPTPQSFKDMGKAIVEMSKRLPMAANDIASIVAAAGQSGMKGDELLQFAELATKVGIAFDMTADQTGTALAKIKTALGLSVDGTRNLADAINHLSNTSASTAPDLIDFMNRVGAQATQFGFTAEQAAALGSAMIASGAEANVAATSFRNMGRALTKGVAATKAQRQAFGALGLSAEQIAKDMQRDAVGTLTRVLEAIRALPKEVQAARISQLFGDEARAIAPLIENVNLYKSALASVADQASYLGSAQKEYEARAATTANAIQLLRNQFTALGISIGAALLPAITSLTTTLGPVISSLGALAEANPRVTQAVVGLTAALIGFRVAAIGVKFAALMAKGGFLQLALAATTAGGGLRSAAGLIGGALVGSLTRVAGAAQIARMRFSMMGAALAAGQIGSGGVIKGTFATITRAILSILNPIGMVKAAWVGLRVALMASGIGLAVAGIAAAGTFIANNWSGLGEMFSAFGTSFMAAIAPIQPVLQPITSAVRSLFDSITGLLGPLDESGAKWREWGAALGAAAGSGVQTLISAIQKIAGALGWVIEKAVAAGNALKSFFGMGGGVEGAAPSAPSKSGPHMRGRRKKGGPISAGSTYLFGEDGPEVATATRSGYVHPNGSGGGPVTVTIAPVFHQTFGAGMDVEEVGETVRKIAREDLRDMIRGVYADQNLEFA